MSEPAWPPPGTVYVVTLPAGSPRSWHARRLYALSRRAGEPSAVALLVRAAEAVRPGEEAVVWADAGGPGDGGFAPCLLGVRVAAGASRRAGVTVAAALGPTLNPRLAHLSELGPVVVNGVVVVRDRGLAPSLEHLVFAVFTAWEQLPFRRTPKTAAVFYADLPVFADWLVDRGRHGADPTASVLGGMAQALYAVTAATYQLHKDPPVLEGGAP